MIKIICAWCKKDMGEKEGKGATGISHSIYPECLEKEINQENEEEAKNAHWFHPSPDHSIQEAGHYYTLPEEITDQRI